MQRWVTRTALLLTLLVLPPTLRAGDSPRWSFATIADSSTQVPQDANGTFSAFGTEPAFSAGIVVFSRRGGSDDRDGIYAATEGMLRVVADQTTIAPTTNLPFEVFGSAPPDVSGDAIVFSANNPRGIYQQIGDSSIAVVVDQNSTIDGDPGFFGPSLNAPASVSSGNIVFIGVNNIFQPGVYALIDDVVQPVALPGVTNNGFLLRSFSGPAIHADASSTSIAIIANDLNSNVDGIFAINGLTEAVATTNTLIPDGNGTFTAFGSPPTPGLALSGDNVAFVGEGTSNQRGLYHTVGGLTRAADRTTPVPNGTGTFFTFENPSMVNDQLLYVATGQGGQIGIYHQSTEHASTPQKVIDATDLLDGRQIVDLKAGRSALDDSGSDRFAFWARFDDNSEGIYVASLLDCTITADDEIQFDTSDHVASAQPGPGIYTWSITGSTIDDGQGTNEITFTAGSDETLTLELTIEDNGISVTCDKVINIRFGPTATADNDGPVCDGQPVTLTAEPAMGVTYAWTGPGGFTSDQQSPVINPAVAGTYTVIVTDENDLSDMASTDVIVNANPVPIATNDGPVCDGFDVILTAEPDGLVIYAWTGPDGFASSEQSPGVSPAIAGTYQLTVTDDNGCLATTTTDVTLFENPDPTADNNGPICLGNDAVLTGGPDDLVSYAWTGPDGFTSDQQSPDVPMAVGGPYELTVTDENGCVGLVTTELFVDAVDVTPPTITCPPNAARNCGDATTPATTGIATGQDNCGAPVTINSSDAVSGNCPRTITRTWTATDESGNETTCDQTITLAELPPPPPDGGGGSGGGGGTGGGTPIPVDMTSGTGTINDDGTFSANAITATGELLASVRFIEAPPGETVTYVVRTINPDVDDLPRDGLIIGPVANRIFTVETTGEPGTFTAIVSLFFTQADLEANDADAIDAQIVVLDETTDPNAWTESGDSEQVGQPSESVGEFGIDQIDDSTYRYWTVRDRLSTFAVGELFNEPANVDPDPPADDPPPDDDEPVDPPAEQPQPSDTDGDGITDDDDLCSDTPSGTMVDETGCPVAQEPDPPTPDMPSDCGAPCGTMGMIGWALLLLGYAPLRSMRRRL